MAPALPDGEPAPADGVLPSSVHEGAQDRAFGVYVHVPFCATRCGYCDFNTYTALELGPGVPAGATALGYPDAAVGELRFARSVLADGGLPTRQVGTVFIGGGTPTLLQPSALIRLLNEIRDEFGLAADTEVTTEANPDTVTAASLAELAAGGVTRVSFGMQSAVPSVLATLERRHDPAAVPTVVGWARAAGLQVSLDLIYGTPGETDDDWRASLDAALACEPDHLSAYALGIEPGTRLARQVARGDLAPVDPDVQARRYEIADEVLAAAGYPWYEISNWARPGRECRHNIGYWSGADWWGIGPGAHSHVGGVRWWNVKHPARYAALVASGLSPAAGREILDDEARLTEAVMLGVRLADGLDRAVLAGLAGPAGSGPAVDARVAALVADGLVTTAGTRVKLTRRGRLLADPVVARLLGW